MEVYKLGDSLYGISGPTTDKEAMKAAGAKWNHKRGRWECGPEEAARALLMGAKATSLVRQDLSEYAQRLQSMLELSQAVDDNSGIDLPGPPTRDYYPYQRAAIRYIEETNGRSLVADDMGVGKTVEAIGWLNLNTLARPVVVLTTASMKLYWKRKLDEWLVGWNTVEVLRGIEGKDEPISADIAVVNYDILDAHLEALMAFRPQVVILDEAHYIKNAGTQRTKAALRLCKGVPYILALTGTPILNRPAEGWTLFHLLSPKVFPNWRDFVVRYCGGHKDRWGHWHTDSATNQKELHDKLRAAFMVRRLKSQVLPQLPEKTYETVEMEVPGAAVYLDAEKAFLGDLGETLTSREQTLREISTLPPEKRRERQKTFNKEVVKEDMNILAAMSKLRQSLGVEKAKPAAEFIQNLLESGQKVVVFAHHQKVIKALAKAFPQGVVMDGSTSASKREEVQRKFREDPACNVFIGSIRACKEGIDLTAASNVVFVEQDWVPGYMRQAEDRCLRHGQKNAVSVYYLLVSGSRVERQVMDTLAAKMPMVDGVLDDARADTVFLDLLKELARREVQLKKPLPRVIPGGPRRDHSTSCL
jgi:SWI/SNF-related matrix-associated actin-dependent regulator 1 of chromatin subfamily A